MSALALVLMAGMAVPGDVPAMASGDVCQGLDLRGGWQGRWWDAKNQCIRFVVIRSDRPGRIVPGCGPSYPFVCHDDGPGAFRGELFGEKALGIFRQDGDSLALCFRPADKGRPTAFQEGDGQHLLILRRARPLK